MWRDEARLADMLIAARDAIGFVTDVSREHFLADIKTQYAVARALEILGEAANAVPEGIREDHPEVPWPGIVGMRNRLIHEYFQVRLDVVWDVVTNELPSLINQLEGIVPPEGDQ